VGSGNADFIGSFEIPLAPGSLTLYLGMIQDLLWLWIKVSVHAEFFCRLIYNFEYNLTRMISS